MSAPKTPLRATTQTYASVLTDIVALLDEARRASARAVNTLMTTTYFEVGRRIVEEEQRGRAKAGYGDALLDQLALDLTRRLGRGFGRRNLFQMRAFYLAYVQRHEFAMKSDIEPKVQTLSALLPRQRPTTAAAFPLPWSHYVRLLTLDNPEARAFYEKEALRGGWTVRQLDRQIGSQFYERTALSRNRAAMLEKASAIRPGDRLAPEDEFKDPFVLEFLDLRDEYSESELEAALIAQMETFLLELGSDFTFVGRQRRLRVGDEWYRVDLIFFHRRLRCLVIIDLKLDKFTHADAGQMHLYLNYAREHWMLPDENPPVGLILCARKDAAVAHYALEGIDNKVLAAEYRTALPDEGVLVRAIERTRERLEARGRRGR